MKNQQKVLYSLNNVAPISMETSVTGGEPVVLRCIPLCMVASQLFLTFQFKVKVASGLSVIFVTPFSVNIVKNSLKRILVGVAKVLIMYDILFTFEHTVIIVRKFNKIPVINKAVGRW